MMSNSEQHEMLVGILCNLVSVLTSDELSLLAHSCGVPVSEFYGNTNNEAFSFDWNIEQCGDNNTIEWRKA